jgi:hypothetical protein
MEDEMRQIEQYMKMAAEYERLAQAASDEVFRTMYSKFARQWHEAAQRAEIAGPGSDHLKSAPSLGGTIDRGP